MKESTTRKKQGAGSAETPPGPQEAVALLRDTARAVKVMKASWLHVALNLQKIHRYELWKYENPPCASYEEYVLERLKLNKYVAARMLRAVVYTEERRPDLIRAVEERRDEEVEIPSYDVVDRLRRIQKAFADREDDFRELEDKVFRDGIGRVVLEREINERLGRERGGDEEEHQGEKGRTEEDSLERIIEDLVAIEKRMLRLKVGKEPQRLIFELIECLEKLRGRGGA